MIPKFVFSPENLLVNKIEEFGIINLFIFEKEDDKNKDNLVVRKLGYFTEGKFKLSKYGFVKLTVSKYKVEKISLNLYQKLSDQNIEEKFKQSMYFV